MTQSAKGKGGRDRVPTVRLSCTVHGPSARGGNGRGRRGRAGSRLVGGLRPAPRGPVYSTALRCAAQEESQTKREELDLWNK